jgi:hypothetical protein
MQERRLKQRIVLASSLGNGMEFNLHIVIGLSIGGPCGNVLHQLTGFQKVAFASDGFAFPQGHWLNVAHLGVAPPSVHRPSAMRDDSNGNQSRETRTDHHRNAVASAGFGLQVLDGGLGSFLRLSCCCWSHCVGGIGDLRKRVAGVLLLHVEQECLDVLGRESFGDVVVQQSLAWHEGGVGRKGNVDVVANLCRVGLVAGSVPLKVGNDRALET